MLSRIFVLFHPQRIKLTQATSLVAIAILGGSLPAAAADDVVFRSDVSLVRVDAQVVDRDNRAITGLRSDDFILREEGRPQPIRNFGSENMPVDVLFLLDVSASMRPHVERIAAASHQALRVLRDEDRAAIMVFDRSTRLRLPFRNSRSEVEREFESLLNEEMFNGGTDITRALLDAANYVGREARRDARRAIVILTDDQTERHRDVEGVSRALTRADAVLCLLLAPDAMATYSPGMGGGRTGGGTWPGGGGAGGPLGGIILGRRGPYGGRGRGPVTRGPHTQPAGTGEIARRSGGDSMSVDDASALETTLARLRQRYALYFYLPQGVNPGEERGIEVDLAPAARAHYSGAEVRYRRVYLAPSGAAPAGTSAEPTMVTRVPVNTAGSTTEAAASPASRLKRRPGVDEDESRRGPLDSGAEPSAATAPPELAPAPQSKQARGDEPASRPSPSAAPATAQEPRCGWRRVDEPANPCPVNGGTGTEVRQTPPQPKPDR